MPQQLTFPPACLTLPDGVSAPLSTLEPNVGSRPSTLERPAAVASRRHLHRTLPTAGTHVWEIDGRRHGCLLSSARYAASLARWTTASRHVCAQPARSATGCPSPKQVLLGLPCHRQSGGSKFGDMSCAAMLLGTWHLLEVLVVELPCRRSWLEMARSCCRTFASGHVAMVIQQESNESAKRRRMAARGASSCARARLCGATHQGRCWPATASCAARPGARLRQDHQHRSYLDGHTT